MRARYVGSRACVYAMGQIERGSRYELDLPDEPTPRQRQTDGRNIVTASEQLYRLGDRAKQSEEKIERAKEESQADLQAQVKRARQASQQRAVALKGTATDAEAKASARWGKVQDDWNEHIARIRQ